MVIAFEQGISAGLFSDSQIRNPTKTFSEIQERVVAHIEGEEVVVRMNDRSRLRQPGPKESNQAWPLRVKETSTEKRTDSRYVSYIDKRDEPKTKGREESDTRPKFWVFYKELLSMAGVANKLKFPQKKD